MVQTARRVARNPGQRGRESVMTDERVQEILKMSRASLRDEMRRGYPIDPRALEGAIYEGVSLGLPRWVERITWKTFAKTFHRIATADHLVGWNVRLQQTGVGSELVPKVHQGDPVTFGHYRVVPCTGFNTPEWCSHGLLIHYGLGGNLRMDPTTWLRDPIVALDEGSVEWLLGWSYIQMGIRIPTLSYFLLRRVGPIPHVAYPPRRLP